MVEDLKQQASELYREQTQTGGIRTSDSLSMKKLFYISLGLVVVLLIVFETFGGHTQKKDAVLTAVTPPPLVKEALPPDPLEPDAEKQSAKEPSAGKPVSSAVESKRAAVSEH